MEIVIIAIVAVAAYFALKFLIKELSSTKTMRGLDKNMALKLEISSAQTTADYISDIKTKDIKHDEVTKTQETLLGAL
ncbi:MAG: hypothetical protein PVF17_00185 [Ignavibacteria bacterium]|jgi:hypothetical protein